MYICSSAINNIESLRASTFSSSAKLSCHQKRKQNQNANHINFSFKVTLMQELKCFVLFSNEMLVMLIANSKTKNKNFILFAAILQQTSGPILIISMF